MNDKVTEHGAFWYRFRNREMLLALLVSYREARRRHFYEQYGDDWPMHEPVGDFMSFEPRNDDEREFLNSVVQRFEEIFKRRLGPKKEKTDG